MADGIVAFEHPRVERPHIGDQLPVGSGARLPGTAREQVEVNAGDAVAALLQQVDQVDADVSLVTGDQDTHGNS
jgi:hypothetical protein